MTCHFFMKYPYKLSLQWSFTLLKSRLKLLNNTLFQIQFGPVPPRSTSVFLVQSGDIQIVFNARLHLLIPQYT